MLLPFVLLQVVAIPYIAQLNPPAGLPVSSVTLLGKGFHPQMTHHDGGGVLESRFINSSAFQCIMPLGHPNNVQLSQTTWVEVKQVLCDQLIFGRRDVGMMPTKSRTQDTIE
jgi:hypothetical protein